MRTAALIIIIVALADVARGTTILEALKLLPKDDLGNLARIEAFDGSPVPERWHILVYEPESKTGVKEYVVAKGQLATSREISQFAETLSQADVIGEGPVQVDSDKLAGMAKDFAEANDLEVAKMSYHMGRQVPGAEPTWQVRCLDDGDKVVGTLVVNSQTGSVLSHEGFASAPAPKKEKSKSTKTATARDDDRPRVKTRSRSANRSPEPIAAREGRRSGRSARQQAPPPEVRRAEPVSNSRSVGGFMRRIFRPRD
jgi:hypothetical protein